MAAVRVRGANDNHRQLLRTRAGGASAVLGQDSTRTETGKYLKPLSLLHYLFIHKLRKKLLLIMWGI